MHGKDHDGSAAISSTYFGNSDGESVLTKFKFVPSLIKTDHFFKHRYRISVVKPMLCLYDFFNAAESQFGITSTIRFYKISYQWLINLHNEYNLQESHMPKFGITSKQLEDYFYTIE